MRGQILKTFVDVNLNLLVIDQLYLANQLDKGQRGDQPDDFKPMSGIGKGVEEIRIAEPSGAYRVIYVARRVDVVYVLHAFQKKTQATPKKDLEIARQRFGKLKGEKL